MQEVKGLVSIVIPAFNAGLFIEETLQSIKDQNYPNWEVILVDDGSEDDTSQKVKAFKHPAIQYQYQKNAGVSSARNTGLSKSTGEYVLFCDADDVLGERFLENRVRTLEDNLQLDYSCGNIETFPYDSIRMQGIHEDVSRTSILFEGGYASVPSNYLFRSIFLKKHLLQFNVKLSSTADRFFLFEAGMFGNCGYSNQGILYYRKTPNSMSAGVSLSLMKDNEKFYLEVLNHHKLKTELRKQFCGKMCYILSVGFLKLGYFLKSIQYVLRGMYKAPYWFLKYMLSK